MSVFDKPKLARSQVAAESVLLKTPAAVAAYSRLGICGSMITTRTTLPSRPLLAGVQLEPPSVLLNTPASVPAYSVGDGALSMAKLNSTRPAGPRATQTLTTGAGVGVA